MSTKGLMADKRVASVEVNDKGKAVRITLADGWLFEGSKGPFDLTNVEHGHKIVKAAISDGTGTKPQRAPKRASSKPERGEGVPPVKDDTRKGITPTFEKPTKPRGHEITVYRLQLIPKGEDRDTIQGKEVCGWLKTSEPLDKKALIERTWSQLRHHMKGATEETHEARSYRWTNKHQTEARGRKEMGSPWAGENHGD